MFLKRSMENYGTEAAAGGGDLTDIIRTNKLASSAQEWQFPINSNPINMNVYSSEYFGDPFADIRDPFLHDIMDTAPTLNNIFHEDMNAADHEILKRPAASSNNNTNMFSRMLQICPANGKFPSSSSSLKVPTDQTDLQQNNSKMETTTAAPPLQISSPRNTPAIKRRKSQAKKVVCIPAPAPANSRPTGEIVPSDLWAWRKYGQKPIKGSPYPRGYYRCSSSKGCSARKQVERSRTDPNMLVITYTSEHNHPWPTQRNALAGSTRSHTSKSTTCSTSKNNIHSSNSLPPQKSSKPKDQEKKKIPTDQEEIIIYNRSLSAVLNVKEEMDEDFDNNNNLDQMEEFDEGFPQSYKPTMPASDSCTKSDQDSFFVDMEATDPLNLLFGDIMGRENKSLDPFAFYDWAGNNSINTTATSTSHAEIRRD
ncbi:probable WRKY transcription factor 14 [Henckelia pumila]|uniref:probable WRKY transcription factor 14 n=1 Tax=Henckelia pumila TaxID=405737 RepID=UPI003C6DD55B